MKDTGEVWRRLPKEICEIVSPMEKSRFKLMAGYDCKNIKLPIFSSAENFESWISNFSLFLMSQTSGRVGRIFDACRGIVKYDRQIALFLLPYAATHIVIEGKNPDMNKSVLLYKLSNIIIFCI